MELREWREGLCKKTGTEKKKKETLTEENKIMKTSVLPVEKNLPANSGDKRDVGSVPGWGRSPGGGHSNPL